MIKLAIIAATYGIPVAYLLDKLRDRLGVNCSKCSAAIAVLRKLNDLGPAQTEKLMKEILK